MRHKPKIHCILESTFKRRISPCRLESRRYGWSYNTCVWLWNNIPQPVRNNDPPFIMKALKTRSSKSQAVYFSILKFQASAWEKAERVGTLIWHKTMVFMLLIAFPCSRIPHWLKSSGKYKLTVGSVPIPNYPSSWDSRHVYSVT